MILIDTSVWADHFRRPEKRLIDLVGRGEVIMHPFVLGELAVGTLRDWDRTIAALNGLPSMVPVSQAAWLALVREKRLQGTGVGFVDVHLLASLEERPVTILWTRDKRLAAKAGKLALSLFVE